MLLKALCLHSVCTLLALCIGDTEELYGRKRAFCMGRSSLGTTEKREDHLFSTFSYLCRHFKNRAIYMGFKDEIQRRRTFGIISIRMRVKQR